MVDHPLTHIVMMRRAPRSRSENLEQTAPPTLPVAADDLSTPYKGCSGWVRTAGDRYLVRTFPLLVHAVLSLISVHAPPLSKQSDVSCVCGEGGFCPPLRPSLAAVQESGCTCP